GLLNVPFGDGLAIEDDLNVLAVASDFLRVPFASLFKEAPLAGKNAVDRAMRLVILNRLVSRVIVIEHLDFHADEGGIPFPRGADANAVVSAGSELEFEAEDEVGVFFFGVEVAPLAVFQANDRPVLDFVGPFSPLPTLEALTVED